MSVIKMILYEIKRMWFVLLLSILIILPDNNRWPVFFALGVLTLSIVIVHLVRKTIFSYIDLKVFIERALNNSIASAIVFAAVIYMITTLAQSIIIFLKP